ncbi:type I 3-dehydroquinate dehydratase [Thiohalorhabdus sp.]|uniref:type I 3-dehydroquinate dehydratase n=1 Tax=Thiohalorhabdus sp. TaxID=3094134 RepID=UPI002FC28A7A
MSRPCLIASLAPASPSDLPPDGADRVTPADLVEVRLDAVEGDSDAAVAVCRSVAGWGRPLLITPRSAGEGGMRDWSEVERRAALSKVWETLPIAYVDVELRDSPGLLEWVLAERPEGVEAIASFHDFAGFPGEGLLEALALEAVAKGAEHFKAAVRVDDLDQMARLACWTRSQSLTQSVLTMAMGPAGTLSRLMSGAFGSWATYGHIATATAPGQLGVGELAELMDRFYPPEGEGEA